MSIRIASDRERSHCYECFKKLASLCRQHAELWDRLNRDWDRMEQNRLKGTDKRSRLNWQLIELARLRDAATETAKASLPPGWCDYAVGNWRWSLVTRPNGATELVSNPRDYQLDRADRNHRLADKAKAASQFGRNR